MQTERSAVSTAVVVVAVVAVLAVAGIGGYFALSGKSGTSSGTSTSVSVPPPQTSTPASTSTTSSSTSSTTSTSSASTTTSVSSSSSASSTATVTGTGSANFLVESSPNGVYIAPGQTINYTTITLTVLSATGVTAANLKVVGLSHGITASLSSSVVDLTSGAQTVGLTLTAASTVAPGAYTYTIEGLAGVTNSTSQFSFKVVPYLIFIDHQVFTPANLTVAAGSTVMWMNTEGVINMTDPGAHNVVFQGSLTASSSTLAQYAVYSYTFTTAGTYDYICSIHPFMHGMIVVTG